MADNPHAEDADLRSRVITSAHGNARLLLDWTPGFALPDRFSAIIEGDWLVYRVEIEVAVEGKRVECVRLTLGSDDGSPVTSTQLRKVRVELCVQLATRAALRPMEQRDGEVVIQQLEGRYGRDDLPSVQLVSRRPRRRDERSREVVQAGEIYEAAVRAGEHPVQAVEQRLSLTNRTAKRRVEEARQAGYLNPTKRGRVSPPKQED